MKSLVGFEKEFEIISKNLIANKLNNSVLICGNKGIGKYFFIIKIIEEYMKLKINADQINHHLTLLDNNSHPNIKILNKKLDEKTGRVKNNITIDQIRELNNFFTETSLIDNFPKFILIDSADDLNISSSNALLKIIEEPPKKTLFILVSDTKEGILDTILSRTQCINFNGLSDEVIADELKNNSAIATEKAVHIAQLSEGNFHKALSLVDNENKDQIFLSMFIDWMRLCYTRNISATIDWVDDIASSGREQQKAFLIFTLEMFRQAIIGHYSSNTLTILTSDQEKFLNKFSPFINHLNIIGLNDTINKAYYHLERNANSKVLLLDVSLKFYALLKKQ